MWWDDWNLSYLPDVFGPLYMGGSVEVAAARTLALWLPTYCAEINRQLGAPVLSVPLDYQYQPDERPVAARTAQVTVMVPNTQGTPERYAGSASAGGGGATRATFLCRVTVFFGGTQNFNESRATAQAYAAAVVATLVQKPGLPQKDGTPFAELTKWLGYRVGVEERSATLWRTRTMVDFAVVLGNTVSPFGGISAPKVTAPPAAVEVSSEHITVTQE
jgi:hypothetical protein